LTVRQKQSFTFELSPSVIATYRQRWFDKSKVLPLTKAKFCLRAIAKGDSDSPPKAVRQKQSFAFDKSKVLPLTKAKVCL
jgi:hypothetical protein